MKIKFLLLFAMLCSSVAFAQTEDEDEKSVYDYSKTKHELAVDVRPIFGGNFNPSLFYRKNYTGSKGKNMGFRLDMSFNNRFNEDQYSFQNFIYNKANNLDYGLRIGLEKQKFINEKFIAYGGLDLIFGFSNLRFRERTDLPPFDNTAFANVDDFRFGIGNFWGVKYHLNSRLSVSAETGFDAIYSNRVIKIAESTQNFSEVDKQDGISSFALNLIPLKALRIAYHF
ncbi:porin family protein [Belliella sp. DSM 107340]|uniref:Porin family protein n=1 Tax=Belliella calami TaxID=2923436 RepID=A0ABS9UKW3_9BACT|nr:porin family protein [Belliella calami]MCH7397212.1 porin family protein [Belliella calami]